MSVPLFPFAIAILLLLGGIYSTYNKRNKIFCWFEGEDGTNEHKWVTDNAGWVIFRRFKFKIMRERMSTMFVNSGIHFLFPTKASCLFFAWYSQYPRNNKNYGRTVISPQVRKVINKSELVESYFKSSSPSTMKKQGALMQYLPLIAICLVVIIGYYLYSNDQSIAKNLAIMQGQIQTLLPK
jgi:hypothetical protein